MNLIMYTENEDQAPAYSIQIQPIIQCTHTTIGKHHTLESS